MPPRLYNGFNTDVSPMANWDIDRLIELVQKFYHKVNFRNNDLEDWMQHSPHLQFNNKSIRLAKTEYNRIWLETSKNNKSGVGNENDLNPGRNRMKTSKTKRMQEHITIAGFLSMNKMLFETPGRKYCQDTVYGSLENIKTKYEDESEADKSTRWMERVLTREEQELASMVDRVFDSNEGETDQVKDDDDDDEVDGDFDNDEEVDNVNTQFDDISHEEDDDEEK